MYNLNNTALVLEGGGMRGSFTAGVLDCFLERELSFPYVVSVSAGAGCGISYVSKQKGRSIYSNIDLQQIRPYIGLSHFLKGKGIIDMDFLFHEYPDLYYPFDYETYFKSSTRSVIVTSNCLTGEAVYQEENTDPERLLSIVKSSCALPLMCPMGEVDGIPTVDGGVCDPIPFVQARKEGFGKQVVVLTRNEGYRKKETVYRLPRFIYRQYPAIRKRLENRNIAYNKTIEELERLEKEGEILVIRPLKPLVVSRTEKDPRKLMDLYQEGYALANEIIDRIISADK